MSRNTHTISVNHDIDLKVKCSRCGGQLTVEGTDEDLSIEPCDTCEDAAKAEAHKEGYDERDAETTT